MLPKISKDYFKLGIFPAANRLIALRRHDLSSATIWSTEWSNRRMGGLRTPLSVEGF